MTSTSFELKTFQRIPLYALSVQSRDRLASYLDAIKILPTSDGYCRDWRGLFQISGFCNQYMSFFESKTYPTKELIKTLEKVPDPETFTGFRGMLEKIDRYDVLDDTYELFVADALKYLEKQATVNRSQQQYVNTNMIPEKFSKCLTVDDFALAERGLPLQKYDAFILYADKDVKFAKKMVTKLEESGLKLCVKDRDFLVGLPFEHDAIRTLLTERCGRLVVILSPDFLASPLNTYTSNLAQWLGITQETRKLIPCIYRPCELPNIFHGINVLNYQKLKIFNNFWERLVSSLQTTSGRGITYPRYNNNMDQMSVQQDMQRLTDSWAWSLKRYVSKHFSVRSANSVGSSVWSNRSSRRRRTSEQLTSSLDQYPCPPNSAISSDRLSEDMSLSTDSFDRIYGTFGGSTPGTSSSGSLYSTDSLSSGSR